jgi:hypothetical protein
MTTFNIDYSEIDRVLVALQEMFPGPIETFSGRPIGLGAITKAKWNGPGWSMWSDHHRTSNHSLKVTVTLQFQQPKMATLFCLRYPELCHRP